MTIHRFLQNTPLGPEDIERLVAAYHQTLRALDLRNHIAAALMCDLECNQHITAMKDQSTLRSRGAGSNLPRA